MALSPPCGRTRGVAPTAVGQIHVAAVIAAAMVPSAARRTADADVVRTVRAPADFPRDERGDVSWAFVEAERVGGMSCGILAVEIRE
jgi:hypothetical protein